MKKIIKNSIKCNHCGDILVSTYTHDYKQCSCGTVAVDGGTAYIRREWTNSQDDFTELSEFEEEEREQIRYLVRGEHHMIKSTILHYPDIWNRSAYKTQYFHNALQNTEYVLCSVSAAEYLGICNATLEDSIYVLTRQECIDNNIAYADNYNVGVLHTTINQTINDLLADDTMDEQVIVESLAELYFKNNYADLTILSENQAAFEHFKPWAEEYYSY